MFKLFIGGCVLLSAFERTEPWEILAAGLFGLALMWLGLLAIKEDNDGDHTGGIT